jgi:hypothetical protein
VIISSGGQASVGSGHRGCNASYVDPCGQSGGHRLERRGREKLPARLEGSCPREEHSR